MTRLTGSDAWGLMEAYNAVYAPQEITEEQIWEEVELWVNSLVEEGYDLSECTWDELYDYYIEEGFKKMNRRKISKQSDRLKASGKADQASTLGNLSAKLDTPDERLFSTRQSRRNKAGGSERSKGKHLQARDDAKKDIEKYGFHEDVDLYDVVLTHLIDEGYADTAEDAVVIMTNMSEDWKESIIEDVLDEGQRILSVRSKSGEEKYKEPKNITRIRDAIGRLPSGRREASRKEAEDRTERANKRSIKRLNAKRNVGGAGSEDDAYHVSGRSNVGSYYPTVPTDYRARKRRASGR